jgi:outer membrane protein
MKKTSIIFFLLIVLSLSEFASAQQQSDVKTYSLKECIDIALKQNPDLQTALTRIAPAGAAVASAFGSYLPSISVSGGYQRQLNAEGGQTVSIMGQLVQLGATDPNSYNLSATANYVLFNGFARESEYSRYQDLLNSQYKSLAYTERLTKLNIYMLYTDVIRKYQIVKTHKQNLEYGKSELDKFRDQYDAGLVHIGIVYSQEAEVGLREGELVTAENDLNIAKSNLLKTMGLQPNLNAEFLESSLPSSVSETELIKFRNDIGSFSVALSSALESREDYSAAKLNVSAAKSSITTARSGYLPVISASGGWSWANSSLTQFGEKGRSYIGLNLSIPIFDQFQTNYQVEYAEMQVKQSEIDLYRIEQNIRASLQQSFLQLEAAEKQISITERTLKAAELNFENYKSRFEEGMANITEYLSANNSLINAQINRINAIYQYFYSQKDLLFQIGKLD